jgi:hypothetical protein
MSRTIGWVADCFVSQGWREEEVGMEDSSDPLEEGATEAGYWRRWCGGTGGPMREEKAE